MTEPLLDVPRMGYFLLYRSEGGLYSRLIEKKQLAAGFPADDAQYTHVEVSFGGPHSVRVWPFERIHVADIFKQYAGRYVRIVRYDDIDYEICRRYKVAGWSLSNCNLKYDIPGIIGFVIKWWKQNTNRFFCSEQAAWALQKEFPQALGNLPPDKVMPAHFTAKEFVTVWEGTITA